MTETPPAPTPSTESNLPVEIRQQDNAELNKSATSAWETALAATKTKEEAVAPEPKPEKKVKAEEAKPDAVEKVIDKAKVEPINDDLPEEFLPKSKKAEESKPEAELDDFDKLMAEEPKGQLKHEHYENLKNASKARVTAAETRAAELAKEIETLKKAPAAQADPAELESLRKERDRLDEIVAKHAFEQSDRFQEQFTTKERGYRDQALKVLKDAGMNGDAEVTLDTLLSSQGRRRMEALENLDNLIPTEKTTLAAIFANLDRVQGDKQATLERHREISKSWAEEAKAAQSHALAKQREQEDSVFKSKVAELALKDPIFRETKVESYNLKLQEDMAKAGKLFLGEANLEEFAVNQIKAARFDAQTETMAKVTKRLELALAELDELKGAGPSIASTKAKPIDSKPKTDMSIEESARLAFQKYAGSGEHMQ